MAAHDLPCSLNIQDTLDVFMIPNTLVNKKSGILVCSKTALHTVFSILCAYGKKADSNDDTVQSILSDDPNGHGRK